MEAVDDTDGFLASEACHDCGRNVRISRKKRCVRCEMIFHQQSIHKLRTRGETQSLWKSGVIEAVECQLCGTTPSNQNPTEFHHVSYDDPAAVECLCQRCHKMLHRELRHRGAYG